MQSYKKHLIEQNRPLKEALQKLDTLAIDAVLFVVDSGDRLIGSLTDGDLRRGFLKGLTIDSSIEQFIHQNPKFVVQDNYSLTTLITYRSKHINIIPVVTADRVVIDVINFRLLKSYLPIDVVIMAGGKGERLHPLTLQTPKPMLKVGDKAILEHNIERLAAFGMKNYTISVRYLGEQIKNSFQDGKSRSISISYIEEEEPMGTIGSVSLIQREFRDHVLVTNSDILTNLDYEDFFLNFSKEEADCSVVTIPYLVDIPYAIFEMNETRILSFKEKPTFNYYANGGIYLFKKECLKHIPKNKKFDATDLLQALIADNKKVISYPHRGYWLDIGRPEDFEKAKLDILHIKF